MYLWTKKSPGVPLAVAEGNVVPAGFQASHRRSSGTPIHLEKQVPFVFKELCHMTYPTFLWTWWRFPVRSLWSPESSSFPSSTADNTILYFCLDRTLVLINSTVLFWMPRYQLTYSFFFFFFGHSELFCCFTGPPVLRIKQSYSFLKVDLFRVERGPKWVLIQFPSRAWNVKTDREKLHRKACVFKAWGPGMEGDLDFSSSVPFVEENTQTLSEAIANAFQLCC